MGVSAFWGVGWVRDIVGLLLRIDSLNSATEIFH
jgi:hypothetical protein